jgi:acetyl-CoA carboxylase biotin carboxyl carrier protein
MAKIDKTDIENIQLISKETKLQNITSVRIKKGNYEIEISSQSNSTKQEFIQLHENKIKQQKDEIIEETVNQENIVKSPMVGVAYLSADPNSSPYVKVGQHVKQGDTLLLIEAMKTFNEIKAPKSGVIKKIVVLNSQPVEFGDVLLIFE